MLSRRSEIIMWLQTCVLGLFLNETLGIDVLLDTYTVKLGSELCGSK